MLNYYLSMSSIYNYSHAFFFSFLLPFFQSSFILSSFFRLPFSHSSLPQCLFSNNSPFNLEATMEEHTQPFRCPELILIVITWIWIYAPHSNPTTYSNKDLQIGDWEMVESPTEESPHTILYFFKHLHSPQYTKPNIFSTTYNFLGMSLFSRCSFII